jgi:hypothetical protein
VKNELLIFSCESETRVARTICYCLECKDEIRHGDTYVHKKGRYQDPRKDTPSEWEAVLCEWCDQDWLILRAAVHRETGEELLEYYGELREKIAEKKDWLKEPAEKALCLRWHQS